MALNDRFNKPGDSWPARLDAQITDHADRFGEWWVARTGVDRRTLTQGMLILSALAALERVIVLHDVLYLFVGFAIFQSLGRTFGTLSGGLIEQMQYEVAGLPGWAASAVNVLCLFSGLMGLANASGFILASLVDGIVPPVALVDPLLGGFALAGWKGAEYIARTNPSGPTGTPRRSTAL